MFPLSMFLIPKTLVDHHQYLRLMVLVLLDAYVAISQIPMICIPRLIKTSYLAGLETSNYHQKGLSTLLASREDSGR